MAPLSYLNGILHGLPGGQSGSRLPQTALIEICNPSPVYYQLLTLKGAHYRQLFRAKETN